MYNVVFILPLSARSASRMMRRGSASSWTACWNQKTVIQPVCSFEWTTTRSIATTTRPCLKKARKKSIIERGQSPPDPAARRQAKLQALQVMAATNSSQPRAEALDDKTIPLSQKIAPCPFISKDNRISWKEYKVRHGRLLEELHSSIKKLQPGELHWLAINVTRIREGRLSSTELFRAIEASLPMIENITDRAILKDLVGWHGKTSVNQFQEMIENTFCHMSAESLPILGKAIQIPAEHVESKYERFLDAKLHAMGSGYRTHFYNSERDLLTRVQWHWHSEGTGDSMLPTLWNPSHVVLMPLHPTTKDTNILSQVKVGDIVTFLVFYKSGQTKCLGKRITGLPGDRVTTIEGKTVQVPDGCFWALGDNPEKSMDSRHFGAVPGSNLKAKHVVAYTLNPPRFRSLW